MIGILAPKNRSKTTEALLKESGGKFIPIKEVVLNITKELVPSYKKQDLTDFDYILPRIDSKRAPFGYQIMRFLDSTDVKKPYGADTVRCAHNKFLSLEVLKKAKIPVPITYMTSSISSAKDIISRMKYPIVVKLVSSFGGKGVMYLESKESAQSVIRTLKLLNKQILIEEFVENPGEDIRSLVVGNEIAASYKRKAKKGEKRSNIQQGGKAVHHRLNKEMEELSFKCAEAMKSDILAIDFLESKEGPTVIETNINPGIKGVSKTTNIDVAKKIIDYVKSQVKK